jgi:hypothetical protein
MLALFPAGATFAIKVGIRGVDADDVDILVGSFSRLVVAFEKFAVNDNSKLDQLVDRAFNELNATIDCAIDNLMVKGKNSVERALPDIVDVLRSEQSKACKNATLMGYGAGGVLDRFRFDRCVVKELISSKPVGFDAISSAYSGLKEVAHAGYCSYRRHPPTSEERKAAKENFASASILLQAYGEVGRLEGCKVSNPEVLYECTQRYAIQQTSKLKAARTIDKENVDVDALEKSFRQMVKPSVQWRWSTEFPFFSRRPYLPSSTLDGYETVLAGYRRADEVVAASLELRRRQYREALGRQILVIDGAATELNLPNEALLKKFAVCMRSRGHCSGYSWPAFDSLVARLEAASKECGRLVRVEDRFSDLVLTKDRENCAKAAAAQTRAIQVQQYFEARSGMQADDALAQEAFDKAPK